MLELINSILVYVVIILGITFLIAIHEFGHLIAAKILRIKVTDFSLGFGPQIFSKKIGETTYGFAPILLGGYVKIAGSNILEDDEDAKDKRSLANATLPKKLFIILMGSVVNFIAAFLIIAIFFGFSGFQKPNTTVHSTIKGYPAHNVLKAGDKVTHINNKKVNSWDSLSKEIKKYPNAAVQVTLIRDGSIMRVRMKSILREKKSMIGIRPSYTKVRNLTIKEATIASWGYISTVVKTLNDLFFKALTGRPAELAKNSGSIVGAVYVAKNTITGFLDFLYYIGAISLFLAYVNLLPIPPTDGGRAAIYIVERIIRRPIKKKTLIAINSIGMALLLTAFVLLLIKDISWISSGKYLEVLK